MAKRRNESESPSPSRIIYQCVASALLSPPLQCAQAASCYNNSLWNINTTLRAPWVTRHHQAVACHPMRLRMVRVPAELCDPSPQSSYAQSALCSPQPRVCVRHCHQKSDIGWCKVIGKLRDKQQAYAPAHILSHHCVMLTHAARNACCLVMRRNCGEAPRTRQANARRGGGCGSCLELNPSVELYSAWYQVPTPELYQGY